MYNVFLMRDFGLLSILIISILCYQLCRKFGCCFTVRIRNNPLIWVESITGKPPNQGALQIVLEFSSDNLWPVIHQLWTYSSIQKI